MTTTSPIRELKAFAAGRSDVQAVLQRVGRGTFDLVVVDGEGNWTRAVFEREDEASAAAAELGAPVAEGWTEDLARRMNRRDHWNEPGGQKRAL